MLIHFILVGKGRLYFSNQQLFSAKNSISIDNISGKIVFSNNDEYTYDSTNKKIYKNGGVLVSEVESFNIIDVSSLANVPDNFVRDLDSTIDNLCVEVKFKKYGSEVYSLDYYYNIEFKNNGLDISGPCDNLGKILPNYIIINTSKDNNNLIIYVKIYFSSIGFIYKDYAGKDVIYEATIENNFIVDDNLDKFDTYKYTFKIDNGNYTFVSLEKIK